MRRGWQLLALLMASGCDAYQPQPPSGDAGVRQAPIAVITTPVGFPPAAVLIDFGGNVVAADAQHPTLNVLDPMSLETEMASAVPGVPDPWSNPQLETGHAGEGVLFVPPGAFFSVDLMSDAAMPLADAGSIGAWAPRLDAAGAAYADLDGGVHLLNGDGGEGLFIPSFGDTVESLAVTLDGHVLVLSSTNGACATIRSTPSVSGSPLTGSFGQSPCRLALASQAGEWLWVMGQTDGGSQVVPVRASALGTAGPLTSVTGLVSSGLVVSSDGATVALLGSGPTYSVALAQVPNILGGTPSPGEQGPWQLTPIGELSDAASGVFDDSDNLYVADPGSGTVAVVQQAQ